MYFFKVIKADSSTTGHRPLRDNLKTIQLFLFVSKLNVLDVNLTFSYQLIPITHLLYFYRRSFKKYYLQFRTGMRA